MKGAPLRFAAAVVGGWVIGRVAVLWPTSLAAPVPAVAPAMAERSVPAPVASRRPSSPVPAPVPAPLTIAGTTPVRQLPPHDRTPLPPSLPIPPEAASPSYAIDRPPPPPGGPLAIQFPATTAPRSADTRLAIDAWLVARPGGDDDLAFGQLGASQGGARLTYTLDRRVALSGRVSAPLRGTGREIGVGVDLKPTRLPVHVLVEQRIDLDAGAIRPAVVAIAGGSVALPWRARIDAYAQAGGVRRRGGFVDAATIVSRPLVTRGRTRFELGGGAWGAAQRGAARLDVGPSVALVTPGAGGTLRLQLDYRTRLAGRARPGAGPALTLAGSF